MTTATNQRFPEMNLRNLNDYTPAQIVFEGVTRLLAQGRFSRTDHGCKYRHPEGAQCGVGLLMLDADFDPEWDEYNSSAMKVMKAPTLQHATEASVEALRNLQSLHDTAAAGFGRGEGTMREVLRSRLGGVYVDVAHEAALAALA